MITKLLIANRGEIACRIIRSARKMGIQTVAVYSDFDENALFVHQADEAVRIGSAEAKNSYLDRDKIIQAALKTQAEAIHPGYGFLSENAQFAQDCLDAKLIFIGPSTESLRIMGLKAESKNRMAAAHVPITPGYHGDNQSAEFLHHQADMIGYPLLIKASAGGGGKGMSLVESSEQFLDALASCQRESLNSFGNHDVLLEKYIQNPRHIEVQIFGDMHGHYVHLFERDCSTQRRHQKVIEEAPAPNYPTDIIQKMHQAAVDAARAIGYIGAGTVEFIAHASGEFYFMEMNTRLQVEHPVTEMITGVDLVEWQIRVANQETLPLDQEAIKCHGHAVEARIYAEDVDHGFLPATGQITYLRLPDKAEGIRLETGIKKDDPIGLFYDPMLAKVIAWGQNRDDAIHRLQHSLGECHLIGVKTNVAFLRRILNSADFRAAHLDTGLIEKNHDNLLRKNQDITSELLIAAACVYMMQAVCCQANNMDQLSQKTSPWQILDSWQENGLKTHREITLSTQEDTVSLLFSCLGHNQFSVRSTSFNTEVTIFAVTPEAMDLEINHWRIKLRYAIDQHKIHVFLLGENLVFDVLTDDLLKTDIESEDRNLCSPMPGIVIKTLVGVGDAVKKDEPLMILEAMKMEHTIVAPHAGVIQRVFFHINDLVSLGDELIAFESDNGGTSNAE